MPPTDPPNGSSLPAGMSIPVLPQAPQPVSGIEGGLQGAARVADTAAGVLQMATAVGASGGEMSADQVVPAALGAVGSALGGASTFVSGIDPAVSQALGMVSAAASLASGGGAFVRSIVDAVEGVASESNRHVVSFEFESGVLPDAEWRVASWTLDERIGRPYRATIVLVCENLDVDAPALLGADAKLTLRRGDDARAIGGIVRRVELGRTTDRARVVTIELVAAVALLELKKDSRIFQHQSAEQVLDAVLGAALEAYDREIELRTRRDHFVREYCVQYAETDLAFAQRLMEEEGITYFFEWDDDGREKLVLVDGNDAFAALQDDAIPFVQQRNETSDAEHVHELTATTRVRTTTFSLTDLDWTALGEKSVVRATEDGQDAQGRDREHYEHERAITLGEYRSSYYEEGDAKTRVQTRRDAHRVEARTLRGVGNVVALTPGRTIEITDHPVADLDGALLVLGVSHRGHAPDLRDLLGNERYASDDVSYECSFEAIPSDVTYRMPEETPKPRVHGLLSAIVVGASGQEIHSDAYRRVRIQMRWDREGTFDERSSCLVRVMQTWAGAGFGSLVLPRVGMEVAVAFLDGDPDRPVIAGCLADADNPPPYTSEADWTKSTFKTKSSPDPGDGEEHFNELRFDDAAGSEEVFLHAEKDLNEVVKHDHSTHVRRNQSNTVDGEQHVHVHRARYVRCDDDEETTIGKDRRTDIVGNDTRDVHKNLVECVYEETSLEYQKTRSLIVGRLARDAYHGGRDIWTNDGERRTVQGDANAYVHGKSDLQVDTHHRIKKGETELVVADGIFGSAVGDITLVVGQNRIAISPNGDIRIFGKQLSLSNGLANIKMSSAGEILIDGPAGVTLSCGSNSVALSTTGVATNGISVNSTATADHTIVGAIVRIN